MKNLNSPQPRKSKSGAPPLDDSDTLQSAVNRHEIDEEELDDLVLGDLCLESDDAFAERLMSAESEVEKLRLKRKKN